MADEAKRKIPLLMVLPPLIFLALAALFLVGMYREDPDVLPSTFAGKPAPALQVEPFGEGEALQDAMLRAPGVKLVNFWASWCAPCRAEHPQLEAMQDAGVTIYGINYKDEPAKARGFLEELGDPYAAKATDPVGRTALDWGVYGVPETFVIDGKGQVVLRFPGPITVSILQEKILPAIQSAAVE